MEASLCKQRYLITLQAHPWCATEICTFSVFRCPKKHWVGEMKNTGKKNTKKKAQSFEEVLWDAAVKLRGKVESSEYKHIVLALVFLKFVSDKFEKAPSAHKRGQGTIS